MQSTSQTSVFCVNIQRLNTAKQTKKLTTVLQKNRDINIFVDSGITDQGHKKIKHVNMNLIAKYNTVSTYTAQRGIYILIKKNLGTIENVQTLGNSTIFFDIKNNDNKTLTIAAIYAPYDADDIHYFEEVDNFLQNRIMGSDFSNDYWRL